MGNESSFCLSLREQLPIAPACSSEGTVAVPLGQSQGSSQEWVSVFASNTP